MDSKPHRQPVEGGQNGVSVLGTGQEPGCGIWTKWRRDRSEAIFLQAIFEETALDVSHVLNSEYKLLPSGRPSPSKKQENKKDIWAVYISIHSTISCSVELLTVDVVSESVL